MKTKTGMLLFLTVLSAACAGSQQTAQEHLEPDVTVSGTLVVEITGLRNSDGTVNVSLFSGPEGFPQDTTAMLRSASIVLAESEERVIRFAGLDYGDYAVSILHDENDNEAMDTGFMGMPTEGFGFSNNPAIGFGAPSFDSCKFTLAESELTLHLRLRYF